MEFDKIKQSKQGAFTLKREGKTYALVARPAYSQRTGCDECAFQHHPGTSGCPLQPYGANKRARDVPSLLCDHVEVQRRMRGTHRVVWMEMA